VPSIQSTLYIARYLLTAKKRTWTDPIKLHRSIRKLQGAGSGRPPDSLGRRHRVERHEIGGFPAYTVRPAQGAGRTHVLYLHGGAYVHPPEADHWRFVGTLVSELGATVTLPLYPLAPDHRWDSTLPVVREAYQRMAAVTDPADQVVMGDSAGGGMTLVLAQELKAAGRPQPRDLVLISPWLDITASDPEMATLDRRDPYLSIPGLVEAGRLYAGTLDRADPRLSPLNGELDGLGRIGVFIGSRDVLYADARRLHAKATRCGIDIGYYEYEDMFHAWVLEQSIPEARRATRRIVDILRT
jgi:monoterpene epsilon-lactone hydrolase